MNHLCTKIAQVPVTSNEMTLAQDLQCGRAQPELSALRILLCEAGQLSVDGAL